MSEKLISRIMSLLLGFSAAAILVGAIFKIQHYPHGDMFIMGGLVSHFIISSFEINRLKRKLVKM